MLATRKPPCYRRRRSTDEAVIDRQSHSHYLGKYGPVESQSGCDRIVGQWLAVGCPTPFAPMS